MSKHLTKLSTESPMGGQKRENEKKSTCYFLKDVNEKEEEGEIKVE